MVITLHRPQTTAHTASFSGSDTPSLQGLHTLSGWALLALGTLRDSTVEMVWEHRAKRQESGQPCGSAPKWMVILGKSLDLPGPVYSSLNESTGYMKDRKAFLSSNFAL